MSVGGHIISMRQVTATETAIWVCDACPHGSTETCVHVETEADMPPIGENVWWQGGMVMWDGDKRTLRKIGYSHDPHECGKREDEE